MTIRNIKIKCEKARSKSAGYDTISGHLKTENDTKFHYECIYMWTGWTHTKSTIMAAVRMGKTNQPGVTV